MPEFTVTAAAHKKDMPAKEGFKPSQIIALTLDDGSTQHQAEWITATTTDADALVGTRIAGTLEASQWGLRFKKDRPAGFAGGGGFKPRDPKDTAAIVRQHSQTAVAGLLQAKAQAGLLTPEDLTPANLKRLHDWYDDDVAAGVERKHPSQRTVGGLPIRNEPEPTSAADIPVQPYETVAQPDGTEPFAA